MARVRWYHFYFLLALFDVVVIVTSLELHRRTLNGLWGLIDATERLDEQGRWVNRAQQAVHDLYDPVNDLFHTRDLASEMGRFKAANVRMEDVLSSAVSHNMNADRLSAQARAMRVDADAIFSAFDTSSPDNREADEAMARMDAAYQGALQSVGMLTAPLAGVRTDLLQGHERDLQEWVRHERYFIAAVVLILVGVLYFGRRLQQADRALAVERRRVEEERKERLAGIGELCSSVAHGIRNPLAAMSSSAQLALQLGTLDADSRERLNDILTEGRRLADRVTRLLNFARAHVETFERFNLSEVVGGAIREVASELDRRRILVKPSFPPERVEVEADRNQIGQAVIELLSNAMEHSTPGGMVRVSCTVANGDGMASFAVEDDGPGVPVEIRGRVFDLFFTTKQQGTGIGLAAVRRIARQHGGDVALHCPNQGGARFVVSLPAAERAGPARRRAIDPREINMPRILIVEDEHVLAKNLRAKLAAEGLEAVVVHTGEEALKVCPKLAPDVVLLDIRLPGVDGLTVLPQLKAQCASTSFIVMTAHGSERVAVDAMKAGACEYLTKPVDLDELLLVVNRAVDQQQISDNLSFLRRQEEMSSGLSRLVGESAAMRGLRETILRLARSEALSLTDPPTVLITGETGTGKDLVARALHYEGPRKKKPFIHVNCTALPPTLFESELFGHVPGAFTGAIKAKRGLFEVAHGGTLFLDEIGDLDPNMQAKLLTTIEHREIRPVGGTDSRSTNVHIIAATNRDLTEAVAGGAFRRDLYHRLRVIELRVPPLRTRKEDVALLADHFLSLHCRRFGVPIKRLEKSAVEACERHEWLGNVRELSHVVESAVLQVEGAEIGPHDLHLERDASPVSSMRIEMTGGKSIEVDFASGKTTLDEIEHTILLAAFEFWGRNLSRAARSLGITREALRYRLNKGAAARKPDDDVEAEHVAKT